MEKSGEGNGNTLQNSCPESPVDREAWWAAVPGVAQSRTLLKRLSSSSRMENSSTHKANQQARKKGTKELEKS